MEEWKTILEHPYFQISNHGRIKKIKTNQILKASHKDKGYCVFITKHHNIAFRKTIHRLVATYFIENPNNYDCINHIDCNKTNNHYENLEWCTKQMNTDHAVNLGRIPRKPIINIETNETFKSVGELARRMNWSLSKAKHTMRRNKIESHPFRYMTFDPLPANEISTHAPQTTGSIFLTPVHNQF
jgi:hypothetical protein